MITKMQMLEKLFIDNPSRVFTDNELNALLKTNRASKMTCESKLIKSLGMSRYVLGI